MWCVVKPGKSQKNFLFTMAVMVMPEVIGRCMSKKICIVTPDAFGSMKHGEIGIHCYFLACFLAGQGHDVTVLLTLLSYKKKQDCGEKSTGSMESS